MKVTLLGCGSSLSRIHDVESDKPSGLAVERNTRLSSALGPGPGASKTFDRP